MGNFDRGFTSIFLKIGEPKVEEFGVRKLFKTKRGCRTKSLKEQVESDTR